LPVSYTVYVVHFCSFATIATDTKNRPSHEISLPKDHDCFYINFIFWQLLRRESMTSELLCVM
jgi:hypothetical protein